MKTARHLLVIDGTNLLRTCYEANPAPESSEKVDGVFKSTLGSYRRAVRRHQPTHMAIAFDVPNSKNWRHELYPAYKATRKPTPQALASRFDEFVQAVRDAGFMAIVRPGFEAEDIVNTICRSWVARTTDDVTAVSTDKDLTQLTEIGVMVHRHFTDEWRDPVWVQKTFGVPVRQLLDLMALTGDKSDDIPGIDGVGPKTAVALLEKYGTLEAILAAGQDGKEKGKLGERLVAHAEDARVSRKLVELATPQLGLNLADMRVDLDLFK